MHIERRLFSFTDGVRGRIAASTAFSVWGRAAVMGRLIPGNRTALRIGMIGSVLDMHRNLCIASALRNPPERLARVRSRRILTRPG